MSISLTFLGGVGTVTGSKYLIEVEGTRVLVDCGLFQGFKQLRQLNWERLPIDPNDIDAVVLTHAHLDHSGYIPLLVKNGFSGPVVCTEATRDLCAILLPDSGYLQEKDAEYANRHGFSRHRPALPLYTKRDAEVCMERFRPISYRREHRIGNNLSARFLPAGHILGAAIIEMKCAGRTIVFSGDLGRPNSATLVDPSPVSHADHLIIESTYGNRQHEQRDPEDVLATLINRTASRGGTILVPAFAVGRAQSLLFHLQRLKTAKRIPDLPIYLDSPMAIDTSELFCKYLGEHKLTAEQCRRSCNVARYVHESEESKSLDQDPMPKLIIAASGMATGGRVLHHLKRFGSDPRNTILFTGFQAGGTRGAAITSGTESIKIHGNDVPIRAEIANLQTLSAHADADEIMAWLAKLTAAPRMTFITHGEPPAAEALRHRIIGELGWHCTVPAYRDKAELE